jgi:DNA-binding transcriptional ArsR family regulator
MEAAITQSAMTGLVIPFVGDPQGGQSMPAWAGVQGKAVWAARSVEEITDVCYALYRLMNSRSDRLTRREWLDEDGVTRIGLDFHDPLVVPDMPIVEFTLDEAHVLLEIPEIAGLIEKIAKMARKTGIRLRLGTQYPSISDLGNKMGIRNQLVAGNIVSYRISTRVTSGMILPSWAPNPFDIPPMTPDGNDTAGTCVAVSSASGGTRPAFQRGVWVKNAHHWADIAAERIPEFGPEDLAALGDDFVDRYDRDATKPATAVAVPRPREENTRPVPIAVPTNRTIRARILDYLTAHGRAHTGVVADALDISKGTASKTLRRLEGDGLVVGVRRGIWATADSDDNDLEDEGASA